MIISISQKSSSGIRRKDVKRKKYELFIANKEQKLEISEHSVESGDIQ